jgi:alkylation response protein AidB-like acyl-CoA dehydrogenase
MDLSYSSSEEQFRSEIRTWLSEHVDPHWRTRYRTTDEYCAYFQEWDREMFRGGWSAIEWPAEYGGRTASAIEQFIFAEECAIWDAPDGLGRIGQRLVAPCLMRFATDTQKEHLPRILSGEEVWCQGFSEPESGSDLGSLRTRATLTEDGRWSLTGRKIWTSYAQYSDFCLLLARTGSQESGSASISVFLVDMRLPGIELRAIRTVTDRTEFNEMTLDDVVLGPDALLGEVNGGWNILRAALVSERSSAYSVRRYRNVRRMLDRLRRIVDQQQDTGSAIETKLGEMYVRATAMQLAIFELLGFESAGRVPPGAESAVKLYVTEGYRANAAAQTMLLDSDHLDGLDNDDGEELLLDILESMHYTISGGTSEIQRNTIARSVLKLASGARA